MTRKPPTDTERITGLRESIEAANGDWHQVTALWSVQADLDWLLSRAERADLDAALASAPVVGEEEQRGVKLADFLAESSYLRCAWIEPERPAEVAALILQFLGLDPTAPIRPAPPPAGLDVERLGFADLLSIGEALLEHYPPDTIVCSHSVKADIGAQTAAAIADVIASCRVSLTESTPAEP